jgi:Fe2+ transport system protein FeoA
LLGFLQDHKLVPGAKIHVLDVAPSLGMLTLGVGQKQLSLGIEAAKKIRVH